MKLVVKVIVNPTAATSFSLRYQLAPEKLANLKITVANSCELGSVIAEINRQIKEKLHFDVEFNWKNVPECIKNDQLFRKAILDKFQTTMREDMGTLDPTVLASRLKMHTNIYASHPDFTKISNQKTRVSCYNFIKSVLAIPSCGERDLDRIIEEYLKIKE